MSPGLIEELANRPGPGGLRGLTCTVPGRRDAPHKMGGITVLEMGDKGVIQKDRKKKAPPSMETLALSLVDVLRNRSSRTMRNRLFPCWAGSA